jgi:para-nitrobenzyl esterase
MSGSQVRSIPKDQATRTAEAVLARLNLRPSQVDELHKVPMRQLRDLLSENAPVAGGLNFAPVVDGRTIPAHIFDPAASELGADVPLMIGSTETEQTWNPNQIYDPLSDNELHDDVMRVLRTDSAGAYQVIATYRKNRPRASNLDLYLILVSDASNFRTGTDLEADRKANQRRAAVYKYYFQWYSPARDGMLRSMHTMDVPFAFANHEIAASELGHGPDQQAMADAHSGTMAAFARTGNPNNKLIPIWPVFDTTTRATMVMNSEWKVASNPYGEEKAAIAAVGGRAPARRTGTE